MRRTVTKGAVLASLAMGMAEARADEKPRPTSVAFHYGAEPPLSNLAVHDWVVLDPAAASKPSDLAGLGEARPLAYVGVGEAAGSAPWSDQVRTEWVIGRNPDWGGRIVDPAHPEWQALLLDEILPGLWARGFRGFFLDTIDAHVAALDDEDARARRWRALVELVRAMRSRFPSAVLVANRGFEILTEIAPHLDGMAAESLFAGWDQGRRRFVEVSDADRAWLARRLARARALGLTTIGIDYLPAHDRARAREIAGQISDLGHLPWVAPPELDAPGVGALEVLPREVLLLWDSAVDPEVAASSAHRFLALPLEHLGLVPRYVDVREPLPARRLAGEIAGVVSWLDGRPLPRPDRLRSFLLRQVGDGVPVALFGALGDEANAAFLDALELERGAPLPASGLVVTEKSELLGFEADPRPVVYELLPLRSRDEAAEPLLELRAGDAVMQPILLAPWGGLALGPFAMTETADGEGRWALDPFRFLARALRLPDVPVVDPTTENGRRVLVAHVDGDGAASRAELPGRPLAVTALRERVLERYRFVHTVSVVEGEIAPYGLYPELSPELEAEARRIFRLPHVRPASHGFVHPFEWRRFEAGEQVHLDIGETPDLEREIQGSLAYVSELAGREVDLFLWTGDALPGPRALEMVRQAGAESLNGGFTVITDERPSVTHVSPLGRPVDGDFQVYAPVMNENVYTEDWQGPFWGYRRVRQTFERTGRPRRLAPIGIYYHLYSATKKASLRALHQVYADALARSPLPVAARTWVDKVRGQRGAVVARTLDGRFLVQGAGAVRTLRVDRDLGALDLTRSEGVAGERTTPVGRYVHLDGGNQSIVAFSRRRAPKGPRLVEASARLVRIARTASTLTLDFEGPPPIAVTVAGGRCRSGPGRSTGEGTRYLLRKGTRLVCRAGGRE